MTKIIIDVNNINIVNNINKGGVAMGSEKKKTRSFSLNDTVCASIDTMTKATGQSSSAIIEAAVQDYITGAFKELLKKQIKENQGILSSWD